MERNTQQKTFTAIAKQFRKKLEKGELSGIFVLLESTMYMYIDIIESWIIIRFVMTSFQILVRQKFWTLCTVV